jgi:ribose transport system permease protein
VIILIVIAALIVLSLALPSFATSTNILNVLGQIAPIGIMAAGLSVVMLTGGIDISLPSLMAMASVFSVSAMAATQSTFIGIVVIFVFGMGVGLFNGFAVAYLKMVPMVVTLSTMTIAAGVATAYTDGRSVIGATETFLKVFNKQSTIVVFILVIVILTFIIKKTKYGRWVYLIGHNQNTATVSGIPTRNTIMLAYMISGMCASIAGILNIASIAAARDSMGPDSQIIDMVTAAVIGGVSINGGYGSPEGAALGAAFVMIIGNIINLNAVPDYYVGVIKGSLMIIAVFIDVLRTRSRAKLS